MQNNGRPGIPLIGAMKMMDIEPFNIASLGWFYPVETITVLQLSHITTLLITLMMPKPQNVDFRVKEYAELHDFAKFFKETPPASVKKLKEAGQLLEQGKAN